MKTITKTSYVLTERDTVALKVAMITNGIDNINVLAKKINMSYSRVHDMIKGKRPMSKRFIDSMTRVGINPFEVCQDEGHIA